MDAEIIHLVIRIEKGNYNDYRVKYSVFDSGMETIELNPSEIKPCFDGCIPATDFCGERTIFAKCNKLIESKTLAETSPYTDTASSCPDSFGFEYVVVRVNKDDETYRISIEYPSTEPQIFKIMKDNVLEENIPESVKGKAIEEILDKLG